MRVTRRHVELASGFVAAFGLAYAMGLSIYHRDRMPFLEGWPLDSSALVVNPRQLSALASAAAFPIWLFLRRQSGRRWLP